MPLTERLKNTYYSLAADVFMDLPVCKAKEFTRLKEALESVIQGEVLLPNSLFKRGLSKDLNHRVEKIQGYLQEPELYVEEEENFPEFRQTVIAAVRKAIERFGSMTEQDKKEQIAWRVTYAKIRAENQKKMRKASPFQSVEVFLNPRDNAKHLAELINQGMAITDVRLDPLDIVRFDESGYPMLRLLEIFTEEFKRAGCYNSNPGIVVDVLGLSDRDVVYLMRQGVNPDFLGLGTQRQETQENGDLEENTSQIVRQGSQSSSRSWILKKIFSFLSCLRSS